MAADARRRADEGAEPVVAVAGVDDVEHEQPVARRAAEHVPVRVPRDLERREAARARRVVHGQAVLVLHGLRRAAAEERVRRAPRVELGLHGRQVRRAAGRRARGGDELRALAPAAARGARVERGARRGREPPVARKELPAGGEAARVVAVVDAADRQDDLRLREPTVTIVGASIKTRRDAGGARQEQLAPEGRRRRVEQRRVAYRFGSQPTSLAQDAGLPRWCAPIQSKRSSSAAAAVSWSTRPL